MVPVSILFRVIWIAKSKGTAHIRAPWTLCRAGSRHSCGPKKSFTVKPLMAASLLGSLESLSTLWIMSKARTRGATSRHVALTVRIYLAKLTKEAASRTFGALTIEAKAPVTCGSTSLSYSCWEYAECSGSGSFSWRNPVTEQVLTGRSKAPMQGTWLQRFVLSFDGPDLPSRVPEVFDFPDVVVCSTSFFKIDWRCGAQTSFCVPGSYWYILSRTFRTAMCPRYGNPQGDLGLSPVPILLEDYGKRSLRIDCIQFQRHIHDQRYSSLCIFELCRLEKQLSQHSLGLGLETHHHSQQQLEVS